MDAASISPNETETSAVSLNTELELDSTAAVTKNGATKGKPSGVYLAEREGKWESVRNFLFQRSCAVYSLIIALIWLFNTIPIIVYLSVNSTFVADDAVSVNVTQVEVSECSEDFYLDNSSGVCRPECGEWDQYSTDTRRAVHGTNITFVIVTLILCVVTLIWSIFRHRVMFRYPNIILIYITLFRIFLSILHLVGYTDEKALYCTSRDRVASFEEGSAYCNIIGSATTFIPTFDLVGLCFHLGTVLFTAYFPFRARTLETKGHYKYLHIVAVVCAVGSSGFLTGIQFGIGGYSRTIVPVFCLASPEGAFGFSIVPVCITCATFLTFVVVLLFKILDLEGWHLKKSEKKKESGEQINSSSNRYTSAQTRLILIFCTYGLATIVNFSAYSVVLRRNGPFSQALDEYLECESLGISARRMCSRETFESFDPTPVTFPLTTISYVLLPLSTLIYVANVEKLFGVCKTKLRISARSTGSSC